MDMLLSNESPSEVSDVIKQMIQLKALERIETIRPHVSANMFSLDTEEEEWYEII